VCFTTDIPLDDVAAHLRSQSVVIEHGPLDKVGACSALRSLYFRDPDGNLIEVSNEVGR
jgi:catechol 2,3-dioxygenase-like lactoylglutathione lyase family enzyme